jgi:hypothetical protein
VVWSCCELRYCVVMVVVVWVVGAGVKGFCGYTELEGGVGGMEVEGGVVVRFALSLSISFLLSLASRRPPTGSKLASIYQPPNLNPHES